MRARSPLKVLDTIGDNPCEVSRPVINKDFTFFSEVKLHIVDIIPVNYEVHSEQVYQRNYSY